MSDTENSTPAPDAVDPDAPAPEGQDEPTQEQGSDSPADPDSTPQEAVQTDSGDGEAVEVQPNQQIEDPEAFYAEHAPYADSGASPPMPDLSGVTPVEVTPYRDDSVDAGRYAEDSGHAGITGAEGYEVGADEAGRDPSSVESKAAKGKRTK